jgi:DNA (cytosine-5)-methyltransferase 1
MALRTISVCSGIGGLDLGVSLATGGQARTVRYVERDAEAASCLVARMGEEGLDPAPVWDDLRTFDARGARRSLGRIDGVIGGIPCQPHSLAGKRGGQSDARDLWPEFRRVVRESGAWFVFLENVPGLLSSKGPRAVPKPSRCRVEYDLGEYVKGGAFHRILADLDEDWFNAEWGVLGSSDVGAPHRRKRLWVFGVRRDQQGMAAAIRDALREEQGRPEPRGAGQAEPGHSGEGLVHPDNRVSSHQPSSEATAQPRPGGRSSRPYEAVAHPDSRGPQSQRSLGLLDGLREAQRDHADRCSLRPPRRSDAEAWSRVPTEAQPCLRGVAPRTPASLELTTRLRALGNGVDPLAAAYAFRTLSARALKHL